MSDCEAHQLVLGIEKSGEVLSSDQRPPALPAPASMGPADATTLGSQLLAAGAYEQALPYLMRGMHGPPSAFKWCRLGKLCRAAGRPDDAVRCYDEALLMEPGERHALVGRSAALADSPNATLTDLLDALSQLSILLTRPGARAPVAWTAYALLRAVCRRHPHPLLIDQASALKELARSIDGRTAEDRQRDLERSLNALLRVREFLGDQPCQRPNACAVREPAADVGPRREPLMLPPGQLSAGTN